MSTETREAESRIRGLTILLCTCVASPSLVCILKSELVASCLWPGATYMCGGVSTVPTAAHPAATCASVQCAPINLHPSVPDTASGALEQGIHEFLKSCSVTTYSVTTYSVI